MLKILLVKFHGLCKLAVDVWWEGISGTQNYWRAHESESVLSPDINLLHWARMESLLIPAISFYTRQSWPCPTSFSHLFTPKSDFPPLEFPSRDAYIKVLMRFFFTAANIIWAWKKTAFPNHLSGLSWSLNWRSKSLQCFWFSFYFRHFQNLSYSLTPF